MRHLAASGELLLNNGRSSVVRLPDALPGPAAPPPPGAPGESCGVGDADAELLERLRRCETTVWPTIVCGGIEDSGAPPAAASASSSWRRLGLCTPKRYTRKPTSAYSAAEMKHAIPLETFTSSLIKNDIDFVTNRIPKIGNTTTAKADIKMTIYAIIVMKVIKFCAEILYRQAAACCEARSSS
eukprot:GHVU01081628.1.p1 GENE.GHVU01081628.1~~GHVU01081628.1.p1  ORF type:complete len:184 (+),score=18.06 GHVU01081628.1:1171-1722(+)